MATVVSSDRGRIRAALAAGDSAVWVGTGAPPADPPGPGRLGVLVGELSSPADREAAVAMAEELFGAPVEVLA